MREGSVGAGDSLNGVHALEKCSLVVSEIHGDELLDDTIIHKALRPAAAVRRTDKGVRVRSRGQGE